MRAQRAYRGSRTWRQPYSHIGCRLQQANGAEDVGDDQHQSTDEEEARHDVRHGQRLGRIDGAGVWPAEQARDPPAEGLVQRAGDVPAVERQKWHQIQQGDEQVDRAQQRHPCDDLLGSAEFGGGGPRAVSVVLKIASKLPKDDFDSKITPFIIRLFGNPDRAIRVCLLDSLPLMIDQLSQKIVNDKIFPQLVQSLLLYFNARLTYTDHWLH